MRRHQQNYPYQIETYTDSIEKFGVKGNQLFTYQLRARSESLTPVHNSASNKPYRLKITAPNERVWNSEGIERVVHGSRGTQEFPAKLIETYRLLAPDTRLGRHFQEQMTELAKRLFPTRDFTKDPIQFCIACEDSANAFYLNRSKPPVVTIHAGLLVGPQAVQSLDELFFVIAHEMGHEWLEREKFAYGKGNEVGADYFATRALAEAGFDRTAGLTFMRRLYQVTGRTQEPLLHTIQQSMDSHPTDRIRPSTLEAALAKVRQDIGDPEQKPTPEPLPADLIDSAREAHWCGFVRNSLESSIGTDDLITLLRTSMEPGGACFCPVNGREMSAYRLQEVAEILDEHLTSPGFQFTPTVDQELHELLLTASQMLDDNKAAFDGESVHGIAGAAHGRMYEVVRNAVAAIAPSAPFHPRAEFGILRRAHDGLALLARSSDTMPISEARQAAVALQDYHRLDARCEAIGIPRELVREIPIPLNTDLREGELVTWNKVVRGALQYPSGSEERATYVYLLGTLGIIDSRLAVETLTQVAASRNHPIREASLVAVTPDGVCKGPATNDVEFFTVLMNHFDAQLSRCVEADDIEGAAAAASTLAKLASAGRGTALCDSVVSDRFWGSSLLKKGISDLWRIHPQNLSPSAALLSDVCRKLEGIKDEVSLDDYRKVLFEVAERMFRLPYEANIEAAVVEIRTPHGSFRLREIELFLLDKEREVLRGTELHLLADRYQYHYDKSPRRGSSIRQQRSELLIPLDDFRDWIEVEWLHTLSVADPTSYNQRPLGSATSLTDAAADISALIRARPELLNKQFLYQLQRESALSLPITWYSQRLEDGFYPNEPPLRAQEIRAASDQISQTVRNLGITWFDEAPGNLAATFNFAAPGFSLEARASLRAAILQSGLQFSDNTTEATHEWIWLQNRQFFNPQQAYQFLGDILDRIEQTPVTERLAALEDIFIHSSIGDSTLRARAIRMLSQSYVERLGHDDGSSTYLAAFQAAMNVRLVQESGSIAKPVKAEIAQALLLDVVAQPQASRYLREAFIGQSLSESEITAINIGGVGVDLLINIFTKKSELRNELLRFLTSPLTDRSVSQCDGVVDKVLRNDRYTRTSLDDARATLLLSGLRSHLPLIHQEFWSMSIAHRAVIGKELLFNGARMDTSEGRSAVDFVLQSVFPGASATSGRLRRAALAYINASEGYMQQLVAAAFLFSAKKVQESPRRHSKEAEGIGLRSFLESTPPAGGKVGQQLPGVASLPKHIADALQSFKSQFNLPRVWDFHAQALADIPPEEYHKIQRFGRPDKAGTIFITCEVQHEEYGDCILQLLRPGIELHGEQEFVAYQKALDTLVLNGDAVDREIARTGSRMIEHGRELLAQEINTTKLVSANQAMHQLYHGDTIDCLDGRKVAFEGPQVLASGSRWILQRKHPGRELSHILADPDVSDADKARYVTAYAWKELRNATSQRRFDQDPHSGNVKIAGDVMYRFDAGCMIPAAMNDEQARVVGEIIGRMVKSAMTLRGSKPAHLLRQVNQEIGDDSNPIAKAFVRQLSSIAECFTTVGRDGKPLIDGPTRRAIAKDLLTTMDPVVREGLESVLPGWMKRVALGR
jgi:hypothetical protein